MYNKLTVTLRSHYSRDLGIDVQLLGGDSRASADMVKECGSNCEGAYLTTDFRSEIPNEVAEKFIADYTAAYGVSPESPAALSYDTDYLLASALQRAAKVHCEAPREDMTTLPKYVDVTGVIQYEAGSGDPIKHANINRS